MPLQLCVFDLDFTIWDAGGTWCDHLQAPFRCSDGVVMDRRGRVVTLYPDIPAILDQLDEMRVPIGIASRTYEPEWAESILRLLGIDDRFAYRAIYPSTKTQHFADLQRQSGIAYDEMLFFDDEHRNIRDVENLGVTAVEVVGDMTIKLFRDALGRSV